MSSRISTNIKKVFSQMMTNSQNISNLRQDTIGNLSIFPNIANLQSFPNNFGNLNKFSITPRDW